MKTIAFQKLGAQSNCNVFINNVFSQSVFKSYFFYFFYTAFLQCLSVLIYNYHVWYSGCNLNLKFVSLSLLKYFAKLLVIISLKIITDICCFLCYFHLKNAGTAQSLLCVSYLFFNIFYILIYLWCILS